MFWQVGGLNEALPAHVPAANVNVVTLRNKDAGGAVGRTTGPAAGDPFNETIALFPGMYPDPDAIDVDTETTALILELASSIGGNPALLAVAVKVFGTADRRDRGARDRARAALGRHRRPGTTAPRSRTT